MTIAEAVAKRTKDLLIEKNMTQYRLIKLTCLDKSTIQSIFKNKTKDIKFSTIYLIANAFGISVNEFINSSYFDVNNIEV